MDDIILFGNSEAGLWAAGKRIV